MALAGLSTKNNHSCISRDCSMCLLLKSLLQVGFYLRALLSVGKLVGQEEQEEAVDRVRQVLARHYTHLTQRYRIV